jgi:hypothetical protein
MASTNAMPTETEAPAITDKPLKRLRGTSSKAGRRLSHQILRDIHRDITNTTRQPTSRLRSSSPTAPTQPNQLQPLQKRRGSTLHPQGSSSAARVTKGGPGSAITEPPRHPDPAASALPMPSCLRSKGFHIFVDPPSPAGDSKGSGRGHRPLEDLQAINLLPQFEQKVFAPPSPPLALESPPPYHRITRLSAIESEGDTFRSVAATAGETVQSTVQSGSGSRLAGGWKGGDRDSSDGMQPITIRTQHGKFAIPQSMSKATIRVILSLRIVHWRYEVIKW